MRETEREREREREVKKRVVVLLEGAKVRWLAIIIVVFVVDVAKQIFSIRKFREIDG